MNVHTTYVVKNKYFYHITKFECEYHVLFRVGNIKLFNYYDVYDPIYNDSETFMRYVGDYEIYYRGGLSHIVKKPKVSNNDKIKKSIFLL